MPRATEIDGGADSQQIIGAPPLGAGLGAAPPEPLPTSIVGMGGALRAVLARLAMQFSVHDTSAAGLHDGARQARAQAEIETIINELRNRGALEPDLSLQQLAPSITPRSHWPRCTGECVGR